MQYAYFKTLNIAQGDLKEILATISDNNVDTLKIYFEAFRGLMVGRGGRPPCTHRVLRTLERAQSDLKSLGPQNCTLRPLSAATL